MSWPGEQKGLLGKFMVFPHEPCMPLHICIVSDVAILNTLLLLPVYLGVVVVCVCVCVCVNVTDC